MCYKNMSFYVPEDCGEDKGLFWPEGVPDLDDACIDKPAEEPLLDNFCPDLCCMYIDLLRGSSLPSSLAPA